MTLTRDVHGEITVSLADALRAAVQAGEITYVTWPGITAAVVPAALARHIANGRSDTDTLRAAAIILRRRVVPGRRSWSRDLLITILHRTADKLDAQ